MSTPDHLFKALSDRNRFRVVAALLQSKELCACQIHEWLGVTGATASKHMGILVASGLVLSRKDGRWVHYRINRRIANLRSSYELDSQSGEGRQETVGGSEEA